MTIKGLYEWAVENNCENCRLGIVYTQIEQESKTRILGEEVIDYDIKPYVTTYNEVWL